jgi:hypothetical protein
MFFWRQKQSHINCMRATDKTTCEEISACNKSSTCPEVDLNRNFPYLFPSFRIKRLIFYSVFWIVLNTEREIPTRHLDGEIDHSIKLP